MSEEARAGLKQELREIRQRILWQDLLICSLLCLMLMLVLCWEVADG